MRDDAGGAKEKVEAPPFSQCCLFTSTWYVRSLRLRTRLADWFTGFVLLQKPGILRCDGEEWKCIHPFTCSLSLRYAPASGSKCDWDCSS